MEIIHRLTYNGTTTVIDEPIGFDNLKMTMKRHDYHGMGAEVSLDNLEFYGQAFSIITQAYAADIDSEIMYTVLADSEEIYSGKIDISTYSVKQGDYQSVSVKVGEIGVKTTFNNRLESEVDLNKCETIDGTAFDKPNWLNIYIPYKHLLYTNRAALLQDKTFTEDIYGNSLCMQGGKLPDSSKNFSLLVMKHYAEEFGTFKANDEGISQIVGNPQGLGYAFEKGSSDEWNATYGIDAECHIRGSISGYVTFIDNPTYAGGSLYSPIHLQVHLTAVYADAQFGTISENIVTTDNIVNAHQGYNGDFSIKFDEIINTEQLIGILLYMDIYSDSFNIHDNAKISISLDRGSYITMMMYDNLTNDDDVYVDMLLTHDALNVVAQAISETALTVKSDWYRTPESKWNAGSIGGGALKALTNGYKIRGLFADEDNERNMPLSFKDLIKSLNAQDCIGWGFSTEDGETCVRVERWDWFYKSDVILTLTDVAEVQTTIDLDRIITELTIGYKKYATNDQYNSIDSPHGKATYANSIKAVSNAETQECEFVADNYAIEETRRAATQQNATTETSYDEVLFVFELVKKGGDYSIGHTAYNGTNIGNDKEFINAKLTPRHMASRWRDYIFATNNNAPFKYSAGELNNHAAFVVLPTYVNAQYSLQPFEGSSFKMEESDSLAYTHAAFQAEKITFSYPLTIAQYKTVKANPYGLVSVNGKQGWITDFKYSFADGMADFTLISKY